MIPVRPTARGTAITLSVVIAIAVALVNMQLTTCMAAAGLTAILVASFIMSWFSLFRLDLERGYSRDGVVGGLVSLPIVIRNKNRWRRQVVAIRETLPFANEQVNNTIIAPLAPKEKRTVNRLVLAAKRGSFQLKKLTLVGGDPAGLFRREKRYYFEDDITIYPERVKLSWMPIRIKRLIRPSATGRPVGVSGMGDEFFGVREYRHSDEVRFINWKASAKQRKLVVQEFEANSLIQINIFLDVDKKNYGADPDDNNFEFLIKTAASILDYLSSMYCHVLFASSKKDLELVTEFGSSFKVKDRIMTQLASLQPVNVSFNSILQAHMDMVMPNSIFYCLGMSEDPDLQNCFDVLIERGVDVRWIHAPSVFFPKNTKGRLKKEVESFDEDHSFISESKVGIVPFVVKREMNIAGVLSYG